MTTLSPRLRSALKSSLTPVEIAPGIWDAGRGSRETRAQYDSFGGAYHLVGGLDTYHRIFWGVSTKAYRDFAREAAANCRNGTLLDAGCGSMLFSARVHQENPSTMVIGTDASVKMLRRAQRRLAEGSPAHHVFLLRGDLLDSPISESACDMVLCLHVAHVLADLEGLLRELRRVLKPGGWLYLTSVVLHGGWRDTYLRMLFRRGIMAAPRNAKEVVAAHQKAFGVEPECNAVGSMVFLKTRCP